MIPWFKELLFSKKAFVSWARSVLLILGMVAQDGKLGLTQDYEWVGYILMAVAVFLRAGEPNKK